MPDLSTRTFSYTCTIETYEVPPTVTRLSITVEGATGGAAQTGTDPAGGGGSFSAASIGSSTLRSTSGHGSATIQPIAP